MVVTLRQGVVTGGFRMLVTRLCSLCTHSAAPHGLCTFPYVDYISIKQALNKTNTKTPRQNFQHSFMSLKILSFTLSLSLIQEYSHLTKLLFFGGGGEKESERERERERERENASGGGAEGERESQAHSMPNAEPD